ncbi:DUF2680 domain-containing protein [Bacillus sp. JJ1566]|uniref:DUF2680 domain-containing protein n=1 Tax=Bacillus sp. JJ1566 TaxID=3122961 RepID=UPI0030003715
MKRMAGIVLLVSFFLLGGVQVNAEMEKDAEKPKVELTDKQKQELDELYLELLETKKEIINKYVEFGVLPKEKADKKLNFLDEHYQKTKEHGYIPMHHHKKHKEDEDKNDQD